MSDKSLFITGLTGYIGGSVLEGIVGKFSGLQITALLRAPTQEFIKHYPNVRVVKGTFDDLDIIERESNAADIVIRTLVYISRRQELVADMCSDAGDTDHLLSCKAIISGMSKKTGTGCISDELENRWEGKANPHVWNDVTEIQEIYDLPDEALHHDVDKMIMDASNDLLKTVCICPPDIYGQNMGVGYRETWMMPSYVKVLLKGKAPFYLGTGENFRAVTHINDVVEFFLIIVDHIIRGGGDVEWGREGFYFVVADEVQWKDVAVAVNKLGIENGWLPTNSGAKSWNAEEVGTAVPGWSPRRALYIWGSNSRAVSARAQRLGWKPRAPSFWESLSSDVQVVLEQSSSDHKP